MLGDGTESTATETAAHNIDRETDHVIGGNFGIAIAGMGNSLIGLIKDPIQLFRFQWNRWRIDPDIVTTLALHQWPSIARVGFTVENTVGMGVEYWVRGHFIKGRHANIG